MKKRHLPKSSFGDKPADRDRQAPNSPTLYGALCGVCPLRDSKPVFGDGPKAPLLAVVGEAPGHHELQAGVPFVGRSGVILESMLQAVGTRVLGHALKRTDVLLTNACLCFPPGGDMRAFLQRTKKAHREQEETKPSAERQRFQSPIECCRPRLMFELGVPRCASCGKWDAVDVSALVANGLDVTGTPPELPLGISCQCIKPRWTKPPFGRVKAVLATGNAALMGLRGSDGIMEKQMYVFENGARK